MAKKENNEEEPKKKINIKIIITIVAIVFILAVLIVLSFVFGLWNKKHVEIFRYGYQYDENTLIISSFEVPYKNYTLYQAFKDKDITLDDFIKKLSKVKDDDKNTIYSYDGSKKNMGNKDFYVMVCESRENIYISRYEENLDNICGIKYDDLEGLSMEVKQDSITSSGCTLVINNTNKYEIPEDYIIQYRNGLVWLNLDTIGKKESSDKVYKDTNFELKVEWKSLYGSLVKGNYRIVKEVNVNGMIVHYITASFEIK